MITLPRTEGEMKPDQYSSRIVLASWLGVFALGALVWYGVYRLLAWGFL